MNETKLTLKMVINDKATEVSITNNRWDMDIFEMVDMFRALLLAAEFAPELINEGLGDET